MLLSFDTRERVSRFLTAMQAVIDRHDILRTAVVWEELPEPMQVVWRSAPLLVEELTVDRGVGEVIEQLTARYDPRYYRLDVRQSPMMRGVLAEDAPHNRWLFQLFHHHLVCDHTTLEIVIQEVRTIMDGHAEQLSMPVPFRNFVAQARSSNAVDAHEAFFTQMLADVDGPTLPFGLQDVYGDGSAIDEAQCPVEASLAQRVREQARLLGVSAASVMHLAWASVIARVSGRSDVVFGTVLFGRMQGAGGADRVGGMILNTLPIRITVGQKGVAAGVLATHRLLTQLLQHEQASLALAQRCSGVAAPAPLFSALLNYRHSPEADPSSVQSVEDGMAVLTAEERTNYPLTLDIDDRGEGFDLTVQMNASVHAQRVCDYMLTALEQMMTALETASDIPMNQMDILPAAERTQLLWEWNETNGDCLHMQTVHQLFETQVERTPEAVAVQCGTETITYAELNRRADQVSQRLMIEGVGSETVVAVLTERSLELVVSVLGVFKAGAGYLPLDPKHPESRWRQIVTQGKVTWLLTTEALQSRFTPAMNSETERICLRVRTVESFADSPITAQFTPSRTRPTQVAYVIYTSGSTGVPKGAVVTQQGMVNNVWGKIATLGLTAADVVAQTASHCFDISVWQLLSALLCGGRVEIFVDEIVRDPTRLLAEMARTGVTVAELVPSLLREVVAVEPPIALPSLRWLLPTGEAVTPELCRAWFGRYPTIPLLNAYGPAECADDVAYYAVTAAPPGEESVVPIGRPAANLQLYILSPDLRPVPIGVAGEICVGGVGVGRGYLEDPARTAAAFVPHPYATSPGARLYRTGDLGRYRADGNIEFLGRQDRQVKVRGFRIELGEIEARLEEQTEVREAVVTAREGRAGEKHLVAYVVADGNGIVTADEIRAHVAQVLPKYMVPTHVVLLEQMPLTPNGKIDRKALPAPDISDELAHQYVAPRTPTEQRLSEIWAEVLQVPHVGIHDNFFELGGHSLLAIRLVSRVRDACRVRLDFASLFSAPTVAGLSAVVDEAEKTIDGADIQWMTGLLNELEEKDA